MRGWQVEVDPNVTVSTEPGRCRLPVNVFLDHRHVARLELALTADQIELIYASTRGLDQREWLDQ